VAKIGIIFEISKLFAEKLQKKIDADLESLHPFCTELLQ
jgi:hypothetical protein